MTRLYVVVRDKLCYVYPAIFPDIHIWLYIIYLELWSIRRYMLCLSFYVLYIELFRHLDPLCLLYCICWLFICVFSKLSIVNLKARFFKFMCKALVHDNSTLKYVTKLACRNPMSVSGRN